MKSVLPILLLSLLAMTALAQTPKPIGERNYVGFEVGPDYSWLGGAQNFVIKFVYPLNSNDSRTTYPISLENPGSGLGFHIGGTFDINLSGAWNIAGKLFYAHQSTKSSEDKTIDLASLDGFLTQSSGTGTFHTTLEQSWGYLGGDLLVRYQIAPESFYVIGGLEVAGSVNNSFHVTQSITASSNADLQYIKYNDQSKTGISTNIEIPENGTSGLYKGMWLGPKLGLGTFIPINGKWVFTPEISVSIPLTDLYEDPYTPPKSPDDIRFYQGNEHFGNATTPPKLWYVQLSIGLKFPFGLKKHAEETPQK